MILYKELTWDTYEPHPDAAELFDLIDQQGKLDEFENLLVETEGEYVDETYVDDLLRFEEDWVIETLNLDVSGTIYDDSDDEDEDEEDEDEEDEDDE
jgi:hypothetical protein